MEPEVNSIVESSENVGDSKISFLDRVKEIDFDKTVDESEAGILIFIRVNKGDKKDAIDATVTGYGEVGGQIQAVEHIGPITMEILKAIGSGIKMEKEKKK